MKEFVKEVGRPTVVSDHGKQFLSSTWEDGLKDMNIRPGMVSTFCPQSNLSERYLKELGVMLRIFLYKRRHLE